MKLRALISAAALCLMTCVAGASEPPLKIVATQVVQPALADLQPSLSACVGVPVAIEYGATSAFVERVMNGERVPIVICSNR